MRISLILMLALAVACSGGGGGQADSGSTDVRTADSGPAPVDAAGRDVGGADGIVASDTGTAPGPDTGGISVVDDPLPLVQWGWSGEEGNVRAAVQAPGSLLYASTHEGWVLSFDLMGNIKWKRNALPGHYLGGLQRTSGGRILAYGGDHINTGADQTGLALLTAEGDLVWTALAGEQVYWADSDGTRVYALAGITLYALAVDGRVLWTHEKDQYGNPALLPSGDIVVPDFPVRVLTPEGTERWRAVESAQFVWAQPDGSVLLVSGALGGTTVARYAADGTALDRVTTQESSSVWLIRHAADGSVCFNQGIEGWDIRLACYHADLRPKMLVEMDADPILDIAILTDGSVVVARAQEIGEGSHLTAYTPTGQERWSVPYSRFDNPYVRMFGDATGGLQLLAGDYVQLIDPEDGSPLVTLGHDLEYSTRANASLVGGTTALAFVVTRSLLALRRNCPGYCAGLRCFPGSDGCADLFTPGVCDIHGREFTPVPPACAEGTGCFHGTCLPCAPTGKTTCRDGNVVEMDSCDAVLGVVEFCAEGTECNGEQCVVGGCSLSNCSSAGFDYSCGTADVVVELVYGGHGPLGLHQATYEYENGHSVRCIFSPDDHGGCFDDLHASCQF